jgi:hypothetical protein
VVTTLVLAAKAGLAVVLLAAGGAKLADLAGFASAVRMFVPSRAPLVLADRAIVGAAVIAAAELAAGAVSLCWPGLNWANLVVLGLAGGFTAVAAVGYSRHRGRPCRCFGALTRREFSVRSLIQAMLMTCAAVLATRPVQPGELNLGLTAHLLLLAAAGLLAAAAGTAARALTAGGLATGMAA